MLQLRYQALLIKHLKMHIQKNIKSDNPDQDLVVFSDPMVMKHFFDELKNEYKNGFYVNVTEERQDLKQTVSYVGRYARRPPISELRIKKYTGDFVTFEFKDYYHNGSKVLHTLKTIEFIRKLIRHIPPHYFNVIRHYGILANRVKKAYQKLTEKLLGAVPDVEKAKTWRERQELLHGKDPLRCRICNKIMKFSSAHYPNSLSSIKAKMDIDFS